MQSHVIVDASSFMYTYWHAHPPVLDQKGSDNRCLKGVWSAIKDLQSGMHVDKFSVVFDDLGGSLFRKALYPPYKANREEKDEELKRQLVTAYQYLSKLGFDCYKMIGEESDDVIGTLAKKYEKEGADVFIATSDKDLLQLITDKVWVLRYLRGGNWEEMNSEACKKHLGVEPEQVADYLALVGDTVDNIPGIAQIGPKKAVELLNSYGKIEALEVLSNEIPYKLKKLLVPHWEDLKVFKKLTTIRTDLNLDDCVVLSAESRIEMIDKRLIYLRF